MAKHYSKRASNKRASNKRASNKRAYKKTRTIRKVRNMTRKIQKGGFKETWMLVVTLVVPALIAYVGGEKLQKLMAILMVLSGSSQGGGGIQSGGGSGKDFLIKQLTELRDKFDPKTDTKEIACVDQIISKLQDKPEPEPALEPAAAVAPVENISQTTESEIIEGLKQTSDAEITSVSQLLDFIKSKATQVLSAAKGKINTKIDLLLGKIKARYNFDDSDMECFRTLKTKLLSDFTNKINVGIEDVKQRQLVQKAIRGVDFVSAGVSAATDAGKAALTNLANDTRAIALRDATKEKIAAGREALTNMANGPRALALKDAGTAAFSKLTSWRPW